MNTIRATNNAIFNDIFWVHLAYVSADDGIERLRTLLRAERHYAPVLSGFEAIDQGRRILADGNASADARRTAENLIWAGNIQLLEHEQRTLVQPNFDGLSCAFARLVSIGSATSFEVHGLRQEDAYFTSFYLYSVTRGDPVRPACASVAEDHPLRRPLALAGHERHPPLPEIRCRHVLDRRQHATHPRRSARLRVDPLRAAASSADGESAPNPWQLGSTASVRVVAPGIAGTSGN